MIYKTTLSTMSDGETLMGLEQRIRDLDTRGDGFAADTSS